MKTEGKKIKRIAITGPESTGKSTLSKALAYHYHTGWVKEYAREYIDNLDRPYNYDDLLEIARGQLAKEQESYLNTNRYLFCDTDLLVLKIWSEHKFRKVHPEILQALKTVRYDVYLLMDIDLPWIFDPQREHPDKRQFFFNWFERELINIGANYKIISGSQDERLKNAIEAIEMNSNK